MTAAASNGIDPKIAKQFVADIDRHMESLATERGSYMVRCKNIRDLIKETKDRAADAGIPRKALNKVLKERELLGKIAGLTEDMDEYEIESVDLIKHALGMLDDTPLGQAAVEKAEKARNRKAAKAAAIDSLADDDAAHAARNGAAIEGGIKSLN